MSDIDRLGLERVMERALDDVAGEGFVHVSFDMDAVDPDTAPGVGTPVRGGLSYREAHLALEIVAESGLAGSLDIVEVNPILDRENATAQIGRRAGCERARGSDSLTRARASLRAEVVTVSLPVAP